MRSLTIISHTEHYKLADDSIVGLGSTVTEINHLLSVFDVITHVAMLHDTSAPPSALPYISDKIKFVALPAVGGRTLGDKMAILFKAPKIIKIIRKAIKTSEYFQFRAPTGIGVFVIPYLIIRASQKGWFKYAGNWKQEHAPLSYRFQKWLLENQTLPVTINGIWNDQPKHCLSFENPCLTQEEIRAGQSIIDAKIFNFPLDLCFVGRVEAAKGVDLIFDALESLDAHSIKKIRAVHFVGEGSGLSAYKKRAELNDLPIIFYGYLSRQDVHHIFAQSHAVLLPSASEGFPKVIAEGMNYGCVPIVSNVSSLSHYITDDQNGFLMGSITNESLRACLHKLLNLKQFKYHQMSKTPLAFINKFSYDYYNERVVNKLLF